MNTDFFSLDDAPAASAPETFDNTPEALRPLFYIRPEVAFLNHGSFGAVPRPVMEHYHRWQLLAEEQPVEFYGRDAAQLLARSRALLAARIGSEPEDLVYVTNATVAVNIVARSLELGTGDEVLATDHEYGACDRAWTFICRNCGAAYRKATIPVPVEDPVDVVDRIFAAVTPATRVLFVSHVTSPTALTFPVAEICRRARAMGIITLVDGAHVPGQIALDLGSIGADFYTGNLHKWLCAPKGSAFLYARAETQSLLEPLVVSWGWEPNEQWAAVSTFISHHEYRGTRDISASLSVPAAWEFQQRYRWNEVRERCHGMILEASDDLMGVLDAEAMTVDGDAGGYRWFEQMRAFLLPDELDGAELKQRLYDDHLVEIPHFRWNNRDTIRISVQGYTSYSELERLIEGIRAIV